MYRHYKGDLYCVICRGTHSETLEEMVVYKDESGKVWIRPASMWDESVDYEGKLVKRFEQIYSCTGVPAIGLACPSKLTQIMDQHTRSTN